MNCPILTERILTLAHRRHMAMDIDDHLISLTYDGKVVARFTPFATQRDIREEADKFLKCPVCGATDNLAVHFTHLGGRGEVAIIQCEDETSCWERYNRSKYA